MSVTLRKPMTMEEFLAWEEQQELRHEFDGFEPHAMTGGSLEHAVIERNLIYSLTGRLMGKPCQPYTSNLKIRVRHSIRYPDAFVACSSQRRGTKVVLDPVVVFEILSPSTAQIDLGIKNEEYRDTPSVKRYVILSQDRQQATVFQRVGDEWVGRIASAGSVLAMPEIDIEIPLNELYRDVDFGA